jgi:hypothetical protein
MSRCTHTGQTSTGLMSRADVRMTGRYFREKTSRLNPLRFQTNLNFRKGEGWIVPGRNRIATPLLQKRLRGVLSVQKPCQQFEIGLLVSCPRRGCKPYSHWPLGATDPTNDIIKDSLVNKALIVASPSCHC